MLASSSFGRRPTSSSRHSLRFLTPQRSALHSRSRTSLPDTVETEPSVADLEAASTGVTAAGYGIADYGSVVIQGGANGEEPVSLYVDEHVAVVAASDILPDMDATFDRLAEDIRGGTGQAIIATGPSATADMGGLVKGAHGPIDVTVVLLEDR